MATLTQTHTNGSSGSSFLSNTQSSGYATCPSSMSTSMNAKGGGILANAHEAPKKPIKPADSGFTSALKNAFIVPQPGKQMKHTGKPLGKSFRREEPLATNGHEGGEVLRRDPRGQNAPVGDGVVLPSDSDGEEDEGGYSDHLSSASSSAGDSSQPDSAWSGVPYGRGRSDTASTTAMSRSLSRSSQASSNNPCKIKFCPLPSSGRLKRANSITIGVAARSQLLQSQGSARTTDNTAAWQAQADAQKGQSQTPSNQLEKTQSNVAPQQGGIARPNDTVDLGEELRKGMLKAFRKIRRGSSVSDGSAASVEKGNGKSSSIEPLAEEDDYYEPAGEKTPKRSESPPLRMSSHIKDDLDEADGTRTPRHEMHRRVSTGAFTGNKSFLEIEERRKRGSMGETDESSEQVAQFAEQLGQTHATRVAHHMGEDRWHYTKEINNNAEAESITSVNSEYDDAKEDPEAIEAERMADEALNKHSAKATKAGAIEKMERHH